jgi:LCP family protein required for cell wall assembly
MTGRAGRAVGALVALGVLASVGVGIVRSGTAEPAQAQPAVVTVSAAHRSSYVPVDTGNRPLYILVLGSDARPGQNLIRQRSDSIHLIGIDKTRTKATILGFPRDSYVPIPGHGHGKINSAMVLGGPDLVVKTIEQLTGIAIDLWVLTWFEGLDQAVDAIGGLDITVPYRMNDPYSHANFEPGPQHLVGWQALAFARDRHDAPNGDFSRSFNQGSMLKAALTQLREQFANDPARLLTWIIAGWRNVRTSLSFDDLLDLAMTATQVNPKNVRNLVLTGSGGYVGGTSVVYLSGASQAAFADLRDDGYVQGNAGVQTSSVP